MSGDLIQIENLSSPSSESLRSVEKTFNKDTGWMSLPFQTDGLKASAAWIRKIRKNQNHLVVLGIGGSHLGIEGVYDFLQPKKKISFFSNVDGYAFEKSLSALNLKKTHFLAISKSGNTSETLLQLSHVLQMLKSKKLKFQNHVSVITEDKPSALKNIADEWGLSFLPMPQDVGGRFSVLSTVGLAPLMWAGVNVKKILEGAQEAAEQKESVAALVDFYIKSFEKEKWISVFWFYCEGLKTFRHWVEQLWSESLGKKLNLKGQKAPRVSTPLVCIGANDQHSLLQQFNEGAQDKSFLFIRNNESEYSKSLQFLAGPELKIFHKRSVGELLGLQAAATKKVMDENGAMTQELTLLDHSPQSIGALIYFFEMLVVNIAERLEINAYDQPGVEAGKKIVLSALS